MCDGLTHLAAVSIFTLSSIAVAQTAAPMDTSGFDPVVIGWPALTDAGIDILITDQKICGQTGPGLCSKW
jgi:hypothetical protein